jgi:hypothetical protein
MQGAVPISNHINPLALSSLYLSLSLFAGFRVQNSMSTPGAR